MDIIKWVSGTPGRPKDFVLTILHIYNCDLHFCWRTQTWPAAKMYLHIHNLPGIFRCFETLIWTATSRWWRGIRHQQRNNNLPIGQNQREQGAHGTEPDHHKISRNDTCKSLQMKYGTEWNFHTCTDWQITRLHLDMRLMYLHVLYCPVPTETETINSNDMSKTSFCCLNLSNDMVASQK